jgi:hypothetical protein
MDHWIGALGIPTGNGEATNGGGVDERIIDGELALQDVIKARYDSTLRGELNAICAMNGTTCESDYRS